MKIKTKNGSYEVKKIDETKGEVGPEPKLNKTKAYPSNPANLIKDLREDVSNAEIQRIGENGLLAFNESGEYVYCEEEYSAESYKR